MSKQRYIVALTSGEMEQLRAALAIQFDSGEIPSRERAAAGRAIAKLDAARIVGLVSSDDVRVLDESFEEYKTVSPLAGRRTTFRRADHARGVLRQAFTTERKP